MSALLQLRLRRAESHLGTRAKASATRSRQNKTTGQPRLADRAGSRVILVLHSPGEKRLRLAEVRLRTVLSVCLTKIERVRAPNGVALRIGTAAHGVFKEMQN